MHPQIRAGSSGGMPDMRDDPGAKDGRVGDEEEQHEVKSLSRKFWIALVLTIPVLIIAMGHAIPGLHIDAIVPRQIGKWIEFGLTTPWFFGRAAFSSPGPGSRSSTAVSICLR